MKKTLGAVFAGAVLTLATAPAAMAQTDTPTSPAETTTTTSETTTTGTEPTSETPTTTSSPTSTTAPVLTQKLAPPQAGNSNGDDPVELPGTTTSESTTPEPPYQDNIGHGFVGLGGEGILVIQCASGPPGDVSTANLNVTGGPDQDEADGRLWNYSVRVATPPTAPTAPFSWTCNGQEGHGVVEFEQEQPPTTTTSPAPTSSTPTSTTAPITTAPATSTTANPGGSAPQGPQVKVEPKGGVETGFGGMAR